MGISWDHQGWTGCWQTKGSVGDAQSCASLVLPALAFLSVPCQLTPSHASALCFQHGLGSPDTPCRHPGAAAWETAAVFHCWHHPFRNETAQVTLKPFPYSKNGTGLQETPAKPQHAHGNHSAQVSAKSSSVIGTMSVDSEQWGQSLGDAYLECRSPAPEQGRGCISPWVWQRKIFWDHLGGKGQVECRVFTLESNGICSERRG